MPRFRRNLWLLLAQNLAAFLGIAVQALVFNLYLVRLDYREDFIGLVVFVQTAAIGLGAFPASSLAPRVGTRRCLIWATLGLGLTFGAMAVATGQIPLLLAAAGSGVAMAFVFVPSAPFLMDNAGPDERRAAFAANFAALSAASIAGSILGGWVPGLIAGPALGVDQAASAHAYRVALLIGAFLTALGALPLLAADDSQVVVPIGPASAAGGETESVGPHVRSLRRDMIAMAVATALLAAGTALVVAFFNVYLRDVVAAPTTSIGTVFAVAAVAMAPASLAGPAMAKRWGSLPVIGLTRLLTVPFILVLALAPPDLPLSALVYVLRAGFVSISQPLDNAFAMELVSPRARGRVAALRTVSWNAGWALATGLGGLAIVAIGYPAIFFAAALLTLGSVVVHWVAFRGR